MGGDDAGPSGCDPRVLHRRLDGLRAGVCERHPAQRGRQKAGERIEKLLASRRIETLVGVGQQRRLAFDRRVHLRMRVPQEIDAVVRHQVEISAALVVPEVAPLTTTQADAAIDVQWDWVQPCPDPHASTHVPAPSNALIKGCSPRPSSRPTAWIPWRIAGAAASSLTRARPLPY